MSRYVCSAQQDKLLIHFNEEQSFKGAPFKDCLMPTGERGTVSVVFGFDHAVGLFCQIYKHAIGGETECLASIDTMFHKLSKSNLLQIIDDFVSEEDKTKYNKQLMQLALDLPF